DGMEGLNIIEFQYGKTDPDVASPVVGFEANPAELALLESRLNDLKIPFENVTSQEDVDFRIIHYNSDLFSHPLFIRLDFPERAGALSDFLRHIKSKTNIVYFNYLYSGERIGRALLGFEFKSQEERSAFQQILIES